MINKRSLFLVLFFLVSASCGPSPPSKKQVLRDVTTQNPTNADNITVEKIFVDKYEKDLAFANVVGDDCMWQLKYKKTDKFWKYDSISEPDCAYLVDTLIETYCNKMIDCVPAVARNNKKNITKDVLENIRTQCMSLIQPLREAFLARHMGNALATLTGGKTAFLSKDVKLCTQATNKAACKDIDPFTNSFGLPECGFLEPKAKSAEASKMVEDVSGDWFVAKYWPGEWPQGYRINSDTTVIGRNLPDIAEPTFNCTLPKGSFYDSSQGTELIYKNKIIKYIAKKDVEWELLTIRRNEVVEELGYRAEGFCTLRHEGATFVEECLGNPGTGDASFDRVPGQNDESQKWFKASCKDGDKAWILCEELDALHSPQVKRVRIMAGTETED